MRAMATAEYDSRALYAREPSSVEQVLAYALACGRQARSQLVENPPGIPIRLDSKQVGELPPAVRRARLDEILLTKNADVALTILKETGFLAAVLPEIMEMVGFGEGRSLHKDVWKHTLQVVIQSVPELAVRWAALFHDVAKPRTRSIGSDGTVHFLHHAEIGARMFTKLSRREQLFESEPELKEKIRFLIYNHQRAHQYDESWTDSAARRFALDMGDHLDDLFALSRADLTTKRKDKRRRFLGQLKELRERIERLRAEDAKPKALPKGLGEALIKTFKLPPSKLIGDIRRELGNAVELGELPLQADFSVYLDFVRANPVRFNLPKA